MKVRKYKSRKFKFKGNRELYIIILLIIMLIIGNILMGCTYVQQRDDGVVTSGGFKKRRSLRFIEDNLIDKKQEENKIKKEFEKECSPPSKKENILNPIENKSKEIILRDDREIKKVDDSNYYENILKRKKLGNEYLENLLLKRSINDNFFLIMVIYNENKKRGLYPYRYIVKDNDSLSKISMYFNRNIQKYINWENIYSNNYNIIGNNPDLIYTGDELIIPNFFILNKY